MDLATWLRDLGLERYEQAFRANDVTPAVLAELTEQDLKDLGVSLGHRRLLLKAVRIQAKSHGTVADQLAGRIAQLLAEAQQIDGSLTPHT